MIWIYPDIPLKDCPYTRAFKKELIEFYKQTFNRN